MVLASLFLVFQCIGWAMGGGDRPLPALAVWPRIWSSIPLFLGHLPESSASSLWLGFVGLGLGLALAAGAPLARRQWQRWRGGDRPSHLPYPLSSADLTQQTLQNCTQLLEAFDDVAALVANRNGEVLLCNQQAHEILGHSSAQILGSEPKWFGMADQFIDEQGHELAPDAFPVQRAIAQKQAIRGVILKQPSPTGNPRWFSVNAVPHRSATSNTGDGDIDLVICSLWDITQRKQLEAAQQQQQSLFQQLVENIESVFWQRNAKTQQITYVSPAYRTIWGREEQDLYQNVTTLFETLHPEDREFLRMTFEPPPVEPFQIEYRILRPDGEIRWICDRGFPVLAEDGTLDYVTGFSQDITEQRQTERTLQHIAEREHAIIRIILHMRRTLDLDQIFRTTTEELRQTLTCDRVVVYQFRPDWSGAFVAESVGKGWLSLIEIFSDVSVLESATTSDRCIVRHLNDDQDLIQDTFLQETQGGAYAQGLRYLSVTDIYEAGFEDCYLNLLKKFQTRAYLTVPIFSNDRLWGLLACYQNDAPRHWDTNETKLVTQIGAQLGIAIQQAQLLQTTRQQALALTAAKQAADAANRAKSEFLANMSHELRTPLNAILGFADMLCQDPDLPPTFQEPLTIIDSSGQHLLNLINDILEMSRIEAGRVTLQPTVFELPALLLELQQLFQLPAKQKEITLEVTCDRQIPSRIFADPGKIRQILINLLGNALKFTAQGSIRLTVQPVSTPELAHTSPIKTHSAASFLPGNPLWLEFAVHDTGIGIAEADQAVLFEAFGQTKSGQQAGGTGLGLTISQRFARLMGGDIQVESVLHQGSCFRLMIPVDQLNTAMPNPNTPSNPVSPEIVMPSRHRILVVEDSFPNRLLLVKLLQSLGYQSIREAENGQVALDVYQEWHPDLIWMDMQMAVMDGYTATKAIRATPLGGKTVIIALTANVFEEQRQLMMDAGCDDFLRKPFRREELAEKLQRFLPCPVSTPTNLL